MDARLRELAHDAWAAYLRDRTEANLRRAQLLYAIGFFPDRRTKLAQDERQLAGKEARTNPKHPDKFWRKVWVKLARPLAADCPGDPAAVARDLIRAMPAALSLKCPGYPTNEAELEEAVSKVLKARNFEPELHMYWVDGALDELKLARAVLRGLGMDKDDAKNLMRSVSD